MTKRILLADDSVITRKVVELAFPKPRYAVSTIAEGSASAERLAEEDPDIVLIATTMPQGTGYDLCTTIRKNPRTAWVPLVLLAGSFEPFDESRARAAGAGGHLRKPFQTKELVSLVERLMEQSPRPGAPRQSAPAAVPRQSAPLGAVTQAPASHVAIQTAAPAPQQSRPQSSAPPPQPAAPTAAAQEAAAREAVGAIAERVVREVAWEVIPDLAEAIIRRRIRELEEQMEKREES